MQFLNLFGLAVRVFAMPVSSCASERVLSRLETFDDEKRSRLSTSLVDEMIVIHFLHKWALNSLRAESGKSGRAHSIVIGSKLLKKSKLEWVQSQKGKDSVRYNTTRTHSYP